MMYLVDQLMKILLKDQLIVHIMIEFHLYLMMKILIDSKFDLLFINISLKSVKPVE